MENSLEIDGSRISFEFVKKPWIKNSYLKFDDGKLVVVSRNERMMQRIVSKHRSWISKHYNQIRSTVRLFDLNSVFYNSKRYMVGYVKSDAMPKADILGDNLIIYAQSHQAAERFIDRMIRDDTLRSCGEMALGKASQISESFREIKARRYRKWGVCKSDRTITFNYCISMLPRELQDYVVSHEVAHLREMNHSQSFWKVVEYLCPNYRQLRKELKSYDSKRRSIYQGEVAVSYQK